MPYSRTGELAGVEAVKWLAVALMLLEHFCRFTLSYLPLPVYLAGRLVFPLFGLCLAVALRGKWDSSAPDRTVVRAATWAAVAALGCMLVRPMLPVNVLATFVLGIAGYHMARAGGVGFIVTGAALFLGQFCEFGTAGVLALMLLFAAADEERESVWLVATFVSCALLGATQHTLAPLLAVPVFLAVMWVDVTVPRVRHVFYATYALQWPVFAVAAWAVHR